MATKKVVITTASVLLVMLVMVGFFSLAADPGTKDDPLVSMSYLAALEPQLQKSIDEMVAKKTAALNAEFDEKMAQARKDLADMVAGGGGAAVLTDADIDAIVARVVQQMGSAPNDPGTSSGITAGFKRVDLEKDKTVTLAIGSTFFLRSGDATVHSASSPGLIDLTSGAAQNSGAIKANTLYTATFDYQKGFKTSNAVIVFIQGDYKVQ